MNAFNGVLYSIYIYRAYLRGSDVLRVMSVFDFLWIRDTSTPRIVVVRSERAMLFQRGFPTRKMWSKKKLAPDAKMCGDTIAAPAVWISPNNVYLWSLEIIRYRVRVCSVYGR